MLIARITEFVSHRLGTKFLLGLAATAAVAIIISRAWIVDDTYITLRVVDNAVNGHGLRWNAAERVQAYTHPLWMLLLYVPYYFTREPYYTSIVLSLVTSAIAIWVIGFRLTADRITAVLALGVLITSRAFVDFSAGNLENPLAHALVALFAVAYFREGSSTRSGLMKLAVLAGLLVLVRTDLALLVGPALAVRAWRQRSHAIGPLLVGAAPVIVWTIFSLIYYGFPFPNTAYAKLGHGVGSGEQFIQGLSYLLEGLVMDPVTLAGSLVALVLCLRRTEHHGWPVAAGIGLYLLYVVRIGGDYMSGRFLAAPFLLSILLLATGAASQRVRRLRLAALIVLGVVAFGSRFVVAPATRIAFLRQHFSDDDPKWNRRRARATFRYIIDQRGDDNPTSPFKVWWNPNHELAHEWINLGRRLSERPPRPFVYGAVGLLGFYAGPRIHIVDAAALGDPLLARLPATRPYFVGHYDRRMPAGYVETLHTGQNVIQDLNLHQYYDDLATVTRGPIWSWARFGAIWRLNLGLNKHLLADYGALDATAEERAGVCWFDTDVKDGVELWERGLRLRMPANCTTPRLSLAVSGPAKYELRYFRDGKVIATQTISVANDSREPIYAKVPIRKGTFDRVDLVLVNDAMPALLKLLRFSDAVY